MSSIDFDRAASYYDQTRGYPAGVDEAVASAIIAAAGATNATRFLEIGVGTGRIAFPLLIRGYDYTGVDLAEAMMERLRAKVADYRATHPDAPPPRLTLQQEDATALSFADATFDVVLSVHVLHLIPHWQEAISEVWRVLKPGGIYLNCGDDTIATEQTLDVYNIWAQIVQALGFTVTHGSMTSYRLALEEFARRGWQYEILRTVTWQVVRTSRQIYESIAQRIWSHTWTVPDDIFTESVHRLEEVLQRDYADQIDAQQTRELQFVITRITKES